MKYRPTCMHCGKPLSEVYGYTKERWNAALHREIRERFGEAGFEKWLKQQRVGTRTFGYEGNGWFCTKTCAFVWAVNRHGGFRGEVK